MPSQSVTDSVGDEETTIPELQALADLATEYGISIVHEAVAFVRHHSLWKDSLRDVEAVKRDNFRLCLDLIHFHGRSWGTFVPRPATYCNPNPAIVSLALLCRNWQSAYLKHVE
ncbi:hypothetical protein B0T10DRAFT_467465 [Thelonectria olida]|uniref:Xylose isomerase-like TIM barrel domain-containing protein n=1 Tax=Thelonectria olida TaxID=1576542 RepID=A0A9P8VPX0_9HYPO|nr:hypothetical protein B0T10DRAFT_467465 [Thelonectria olida]